MRKRWTEHRPAARRRRLPLRRSEKKMARETRARRAHATPDGARRSFPHPGRRESRPKPLGDRDGENTPFIDALFDFPEACRRNELVHFALGAAAHDPRLSLPMAG